MVHMGVRLINIMQQGIGRTVGLASDDHEAGTPHHLPHPYVGDGALCGGKALRTVPTSAASRVGARDRDSMASDRGKDLMIKHFSILYVGQIELENVGR